MKLHFHREIVSGLVVLIAFKEVSAFYDLIFFDDRKELCHNSQVWKALKNFNWNELWSIDCPHQLSVAIPYSLDYLYWILSDSDPQLLHVVE